MAKPDFQVTIRLSQQEKDEIEAYAQIFYLDAVGLLALLLAREVRVGRLRSLLENDVPPDVPRKTKVTVRLRENERAEVTSIAEALGQSQSHVGAVLVRAELAERWLESVCPTQIESHSED